MHVALLATGVYKREVIVPALTMVAVANMVKLANGIVRYADSAPDNINPSLAQIKACFTSNTRAVIVCHTYLDAALRPRKSGGFFIF